VENGFDKLPEKMKFFRDLLYMKGDRPIIIYGHCEVSYMPCVSKASYIVFTNITGWN